MRSIVLGYWFRARNVGMQIERLDEEVQMMADGD